LARRRRVKRQQDAYGKRARREGFPARSVYKLEEIDRRLRLLRRGMRVLDLGAAPGSWTLYAARKVQREGKVVSIDLKPHEGAMPPQVDFRVADIRDVDVESLGGEFDLVISDMAPKTSGMRDADQYRSYELFCTAVDVAERVLVPGGAFVGKIFQGTEFEMARDHLRRVFAKERIIRPKATRDESYELFLCGLDRRPRAETPEPTDDAAGAAEDERAADAVEPAESSDAG